MKFNKLLAPVALAFNALVTPAAFADEPKDARTLTQEEKLGFLNCQLEGPSQESASIIMKEFEKAQELQDQQEQNNPSAMDEIEKLSHDLAKAMAELYVIMAVNYYACGLDMNIDLETLPPMNVSIKEHNAPRP